MSANHESVVHPPHRLLRPYLATMAGYRHEGLPPGTHRGVPSPGLVMVVTVDRPVVVADHADPAQAPSAYDALVGGLHTRPALISHSGQMCGVQLSLTPLGARALLGAPAAVVASWDLDLTDVLGAPGTELVERVRAATGWPGRFAAVEQVLLRLARDHATIEPEVAEAWRLTTAAYGGLRIEEVARRVGWSSRHLGGRFRAEIGLTPKEAARVARFDRSRSLLFRRVRGGRPADFATLAAVSGYTDQAHLSREWRSMTGLPPARYVAAELGFVQDSRSAVEAESTA